MNLGDVCTEWSPCTHGVGQPSHSGGPSDTKVARSGIVLNVCFGWCNDYWVGDEQLLSLAESLQLKTIFDQLTSMEIC